MTRSVLTSSLATNLDLIPTGGPMLRPTLLPFHPVPGLSSISRPQSLLKSMQSTTMVLIKDPAVFLLTVNILGVLCPGNPGEHPEEQADLH